MINRDKFNFKGVLPLMKKVTRKTKEELYQELMQAIIEKQKGILGQQVAVDRAKRVEEIWISEDGRILQVKGNAEEALQSLINEYYKLTTQAGLDGCVEVIKEHLGRNVGLELPEEVKVLLKN